ncbi:MAG: ankyrin repeat domain-containing protein [Candidatus Eremiobacterota bacterium]
MVTRRDERVDEDPADPGMDLLIEFGRAVQSGADAGRAFLRQHPECLTLQFGPDSFLQLHCWDLPSVMLLVECGADADLPNRYGSTPLAYAAGSGHRDVARYLLSRGADPNRCNNGGSSPLHIAALEGQPEIARILIEHGADVNASDHVHRRPIHLVPFIPSKVVDLQQECRSRTETLRVLLEAGAEVNPKGCWSTPLHQAAMSAHLCPEFAIILLEHGADPNAPNSRGVLPEAFLKRSAGQAVRDAFRRARGDGGGV